MQQLCFLLCLNPAFSVRVSRIIDCTSQRSTVYYIQEAFVNVKLLLKMLQKLKNFSSTASFNCAVRRNVKKCSNMGLLHSNHTIALSCTKTLANVSRTASSYRAGQGRGSAEEWERSKIAHEPRRSFYCAAPPSRLGGS